MNWCSVSFFGGEKMKYKWENIGGSADNLGRQFEKIVKGCNQGSIESRWRYTKGTERFIKFVGQQFKLQKIQNIQDKHLRSYVEHLQERGAADKYIKTELSAIRFFHRQIPQSKYELENSIKFNRGCGLGSTPDGRADRAWTEREIKEMKNIASQMGRTEISKVIEAARATGGRLDEVCSLKRHEAETALKKGTLTFSNTKGGYPRDITLTQRGRMCLENAIKGVARGEYVFTPSETKIHRFEAQVQDFIYNHRDKIQDQDRENSGHNLEQNQRGALTAHGLRHTFAREYYNQKVQEYMDKGLSKENAELLARKDTSPILGHFRPQVTLIYAR